MMYKQVNLTVKIHGFFFQEKSYTLHTDLTLSEEEILSKCNSTTRNEIRRTEREGCEFSYEEKKDVFLKVFNDFAKKKGIAGQSFKSLNTYGSNLVLTSIRENGVISAVHSYLCDFDLKKVRLLHSATRRFIENLDGQKAARLNKFLHFMDIKIFKKYGFEIYDWGGVAYGTDNKILQGINKFKESFGGQLIEQKDLYSPIYFLILKLFQNN